MLAYHSKPCVTAITRVSFLGPDFHMTYNNDRPDGYTRMEIHESATLHGEMAIRVRLLLFHHVGPRVRSETPQSMWNWRLTSLSLNMFFPSLRFCHLQRRARYSSHLFRRHQITQIGVDQTSTPLTSMSGNSRCSPCQKYKTTESWQWSPYRGNRFTLLTKVGRAFTAYGHGQDGNASLRMTAHRVSEVYRMLIMTDGPLSWPH